MSDAHVNPLDPQDSTAVPNEPTHETSFQHQVSLVSLMTLANAAELTARVALRLNQNGTCAAVGGESLTPGLVHNLAGSVFGKKIANELKV